MSTVKLRARVTFEWEYDADPEHYGTDDPKKMAAIDAESMEDDTDAFTCSQTPTIVVEPA